MNEAVKTRESLLTTPQAADFLGLAAPTLESWRCRGTAGPRYVRLSKRAVRYRAADLDEWVRAHAVGSDPVGA